MLNEMIAQHDKLEAVCGPMSDAEMDAITDAGARLAETILLHRCETTVEAAAKIRWIAGLISEDDSPITTIERLHRVADQLDALHHV
ncbi:hypothetical protein T8J41_16010 [Nitratireductor rhodophyticola]|uniref:hypothetical protein n=1 Tax=Nitratireductor rhodophyticola TaxID=2854036 RepID=UPI002AC99E56|nr:hypothetical protein [Nitratireductor rhodophyticola]WPZ13638.1 hypothetical protein T8J41_16010 [Nitratireductor rhodophyticola]